MSILNCIYNGMVRFQEGTIELEKMELIWLNDGEISGFYEMDLSPEEEC